MLSVHFYELNKINDDKLRYAVIMARFKGKWIFVKHKDRTTWEIPGGRREENEEIEVTAARELREETAAKNFNLNPVCIYSVDRHQQKESFGCLFYAEIKDFDEELCYEIEEIQLCEQCPNNLTYPIIQSHLFRKIESIVK